MTLDLWIRNARVIDGTGAPWFRADVGVQDGKIQWVGQAREVQARQVFDAQSLWLAPGFIDSHTHDDTAVLEHRSHPTKARQGVTTVVVGNCSFSNYPLTGPGLLCDHYQTLLGPTPQDLFFADFAGYHHRLNTQGCAVNVVSLVGHAALRLAVMGYSQRPANRQELQQMGELLDLQLRQGAHGLSLGLVYPPSAYADREELLALSRVVSSHGALLTAHVRSYEGALLDSIQEFIDLLEHTGASGLLSHLQSAGRPNWGRVPEALDLLEQARSRGVDVSTDMYPYPAGSSTILQLLPPSAQQGGMEALLQSFADPVQRSFLKAQTESGSEPGWESKIRLIGWENVQIAGVVSETLKHLEGHPMTAAADLLQMEPFDVLSLLVQQDEGRTSVILFQLSENDVCCVMQHRLHMLGSDSIPRAGGRPHPRTCGSFPRLIGRFVQQGMMPLEEAIRKVTSLPAQRFQLFDRGLIRPGMQADLCLFGSDFIDVATFEHPAQHPTGLKAVWVNGVQTLNQDRLLDLFPGQMLNRNPTFTAESQEKKHA